jgi:hypothetical protein
MEIVRNGDTYVAIMNEDEVNDIRHALYWRLDKAETEWWQHTTDNGTKKPKEKDELGEELRRRYLRLERNYVTVSQAIRNRK